MMILVVGLLEYDSGKTSVAMSLVRYARSKGIDAVGAKPVGGHDAWSQYQTLVRSLEIGMLVGEDAYKLWEVSDRCEPIELISPLDILTVPPDPRLYEDYWDYEATSRSLLERAVLVRITRFKGGNSVTRHYVIDRNLRRTVPTLRREVEKLARIVRAEHATPGDILRIAEEATRHVDLAVKTLASKHKLLVVESFNDAACPSPACLEADSVVLVAPGRAYVYRGRDYAKAVESLAASRGLHIVTGEVVRLLKPYASIELLPRVKKDLGKPLKDIECVFKFAASRFVKSEC